MILISTLKPGPILVRLNTNERVVLADKVLPSQSGLTASFDRRGNHIYIGSKKGRVTVIEVNTFNVVASFCLVTNVKADLVIREIEFAKKGRSVCFCTDYLKFV